jgi:hypothetical protein
MQPAYFSAPATLEFSLAVSRAIEVHLLLSGSRAIFAHQNAASKFGSPAIVSFSPTRVEL